MAYRLLPGVMQDGKGRYFQHAVYPNGKSIRVDIPAPKQKPFTFRFSSSDGGHLWHYDENAKSRVYPCGRASCYVCKVAPHMPVEENHGS